MSLDPRWLAYGHDEEGEGFGEPVRQPGEGWALQQRAGAGLAALGALALLTQLGGSSLAGSWEGFLLAFGLPVAGALLWFRGRYEGTTEGIKHDDLMFTSLASRGVAGWGLGVLLTGFYVLLYWYPGQIERFTRLCDPLAQLMVGQAADQWFLYSVLYTLAILVFGVRMFWRYRHSRYHQIRTASVMAVQLVLAFLLPQFLRALGQPEFYFSYFWPLKPEYLFPGGWEWLGQSGNFGRFAFGWALVMSFAATPVLTWYFGKRWYCSWVCGCGGLAETMGDPFRQLSDKSTTAWKIERGIIYSVLVAIVVITAMLWIDFARGGDAFGAFDQQARRWYGFFIGAMFAGVIGVGFYPLLGSRVWCRFGCPMAAILGLLQRFASRFRITTNGGQCMSCGNCSTYCEMGIDVRAYAQEGRNIVRASCVGCGVCAAVCPRGVLKLENGAGAGDRYPAAERPLDAILEALQHARVYEGSPDRARRYGEGAARAVATAPDPRR